MSEPLEPGWHPDPEAPATLQRFYDGSGWSDDTRPAGGRSRERRSVG
jgi:hypothetical protein